MKVLIATLLFSVGTAFAQQKVDWNKLPFEIKKPVKTFTEDEKAGVYLGGMTQIKWCAQSGEYYVSDRKNSQIYVFDDKLNYLRTISRFGQGPCEFNEIGGVDFDSKGRLVVTDHQNLRIQILERDGSFVSSFVIPDYLGFCRFAVTDPHDLVYFNYAHRDSLFTIYNLNGTEMGLFGDKVPYDDPFFSRIKNEVSYVIDESGLYCAFWEQPILRKYGPDHQLLCEVNYSSMPEIEKCRKDTDTRRKKTYGNSPKGRGVLYSYVKGFSSDAQHLYLAIWYDGGPNKPAKVSVYVLNKADLSFDRKIQFDVNPDHYFIQYLECSHPRQIVAMDFSWSTLYLYDK